MRRFVNFLVFLPLALVLLLVALANRVPTLLSLDPINPADPVLSVKLPLFVYLFLALIIGVIIGGASTWLSQRRHRKDARRLRRETARMKSDIAKAEIARAKALAARHDEPQGTRPGALAIAARH